MPPKPHRWSIDVVWNRAGLGLGGTAGLEMPVGLEVRVGLPAGGAAARASLRPG